MEEKVKKVIMMLFFFLGMMIFERTVAVAEIKTFNVVLMWNVAELIDIDGFKIYCGKNKGGPYTGINIEGGNPLTIPIEDILDTNNLSHAMSVTMDTETEKNAFCTMTAYNSIGEESEISNETSLAPQLISISMYSDESTISILGTRELEIVTNSYISLNANAGEYDFGEPVIINSGKFHSTYTEFVIIGRNTGKVWVIKRNKVNKTLIPPEEWLASVELDNIDAIVPLNFNRGDEIGFGRNKDDIAVIDYLNGYVKIFINDDGTSFDPIPVSDGGYGTFSGEYTFQKGLAGDFTGNGCDDLALYAPITKNIVVWQSDGGSIIDRSVWAHGGSAYAYPYAIDYNGDKKKDLMFFNFIGGAFSAFASDGNSFTFETVRFFSPNAFDYALVDNFVVSNGAKCEFGIHATNTTGNFVVFEYAPTIPNDPDPFKTRKVWLNTSGEYLY